MKYSQIINNFKMRVGVILLIEVNVFFSKNSV